VFIPPPSRYVATRTKSGNRHGLLDQPTLILGVDAFIGPACTFVWTAKAIRE